MTGRKLAPLQIEELILQPGEDWMDAPGLWRLLRIESGAAYWISAQARYGLAAQDVLVIGPEAVGTVRSSQLGVVTMQAFSFSPELLWGVLTVAERHFFEGADLRNSEARLIPSRDPFAARFAAVVRRQAALNPLSQRLRALELASDLFVEPLSRQAPAPQNGASGRDRFLRLIARLADNDLLRYAPNELAQMCGCSPRHFNRLFRLEFGVSVRERQTQLRLVKAKALLVASEDKIITIAQSCGYRSLGLFNAVFKSRVGASPSEWRRKIAREATQPT